MTLFDLNATWKIAFTESCQIRNFAATATFSISIKSLWKSLNLVETWKYWSLKETITSYKQKLVYEDNHGEILGTKYDNQAKWDKSRKLW